MSSLIKNLKTTFPIKKISLINIKLISFGEFATKTLMLMRKHAKRKQEPNGAIPLSL